VLNIDAFKSKIISCRGYTHNEFISLLLGEIIPSKYNNFSQCVGCIGMYNYEDIVKNISSIDLNYLQFNKRIKLSKYQMKSLKLLKEMI